MTTTGSSRVPLVIGSAMVVLATIAVASFTTIAQRARAGRLPEPEAVIDSASAPIASEAGMFTSSLRAFAFVTDGARRRAAHPRTLAGWRMLRAFPGAPPRIPHGLTREEFLGTGCNACHERGGYSQRFGAYAPLTPHPQLAACTQCHLSDAAVTSIALQEANATPDMRCRQCHSPGNVLRAGTEDSPAGMSWPAVADRIVAHSPPVIPHGLEFRESCVACHAGPGAVAEIRTDHPERIYCRQCHLSVVAIALAPLGTATARATPGGVR
jgi:cytochrome c-type protein NapB